MVQWYFFIWGSKNRGSMDLVHETGCMYSVHDLMESKHCNTFYYELLCNTCNVDIFLLLLYSDQSTRHHLKNVYACLSASMLAAAVGSGVHLFTDILKVWTVLQDIARKKTVFRTIYSVTNSTGATQPFSANHKTSSEQKNWSSFISDQSQIRDLWWKVVYFHQRRDD